MTTPCRRPGRSVATLPGVRRAPRVVLGLVAVVVLGSCAKPTVGPAQQMLQRVSSADFPDRYSFNAEPRVDTPVACLLTNPRFSGQVDVTDARMQIRVTAPARGRIIVDDGTAFVDQALLRRELEGRWLRLDEQTTDAVMAAAHEAAGPVLDPYIDPPALPADPNSIVTEAAESAASIQWLGSRTESGRSLDGVRLILDRDLVATTDSQLTTTAPTIRSADPVVEAWADADGIVRELVVGHLSDTDVIGGYATTYTELEAMAIEPPIGPWASAAELLAAPELRGSCELDVGS